MWAGVSGEDCLPCSPLLRSLPRSETRNSGFPSRTFTPQFCSTLLNLRYLPGREVMRGNQQSYRWLRSLCRIFLLAGFFGVNGNVLLAVGSLAQQAVPPTARQAAAMPKYASRLAHARTVPLNPSRLPVARLNRRRGSPQDQVIYDNGPTTYTADAWAINFGFVVSDSLSLSSSSPATAAAFVLWLSPGDTAPTVDLLVGTSPFANDVASFTGLTSTGSTNLGSNQYGFNLEQWTTPLILGR